MSASNGDPALASRIRILLDSRHIHHGPRHRRRPAQGGHDRRTLERAQLEILEHLTLAAEYRDDHTGRHTRRVGHASALLAEALGLSQGQVELIRLAAPLHDIGKIGIPDPILLKPGKLTVEEYEIIKTHTIIGARILEGSRFPVLHLAEEIALTHHERWDGAGYPQGLAGASIPLCGRVVAVADAFDAMTNRTYRKPLTEEEAWAVLWSGAGTQWDRAVVEAFASLQADLAGWGSTKAV